MNDEKRLVVRVMDFPGLASVRDRARVMDIAFRGPILTQQQAVDQMKDLAKRMGLRSDFRGWERNENDHDIRYHISLMPWINWDKKENPGPGAYQLQWSFSPYFHVEKLFERSPGCAGKPASI